MSIANSAGRRMVTRPCPACGEVKTFDTRTETCSNACGYKWRSMKQKREAVSFDSPSETHEQTPTSWTISLPKTRICTLDQLIAQCKIDLDTWEIERFVVNKWEVGAKDAESNIQIAPLFQVKAWLKKRLAIVDAREELAAMKRAAKKWTPRYPAIRRPKKCVGNMVEFSAPDLHLGRLAWGRETGYGDYDTKIATERYRDAITSLITRIEPYNIERVLLVVGNDLLNHDNREGTTTKGTPQNTDSRYQKVFGKARELKQWAIDRLRQIAPVDVLFVSGNHDTLAVWHLGDSLEAWYAKCADVTINNEPTLRKYYQWGKVGLLFLHGNVGKMKDYPLLFASERSDIWGSTLWREIHTGDKHRVHLEEQHGIRVRILPSLAESSHWESENLFTGSIQSAEAYVWNKVEGLIGTASYSVLGGRDVGAN